jgi:hypothetical protein
MTITTTCKYVLLLAVSAIGPAPWLHAASVTLNFDSVPLGPGECTNGSSYLSSFGITFVPVTAGAAPQICNASGGSAIPSSVANFFAASPPVTNNPVSYELHFDMPLTSFAFTRTGVISISTSPAWTMRAFDAAGTELSSVSEGILSGPPAMSFVLAGPGIEYIRMDADNAGFATFNHPPLDDLSLRVVPEPATIWLLGAAALGTMLSRRCLLSADQDR